MDFTAQLLDWYAAHRRYLPWKEDADPYKIWVSEIILQQTRVAQGLDYYNRFTARFPTVQLLAEATEDHVLKQWQGLGYYSRARNLHRTAREIVARYDGEFPETRDELLQLKGIGPYTASAIASFAFNASVAALDGNGYRILSRFFEVDLSPQTAAGKKAFEQLAQALLPPEQSARFNQALMDFGSLVCLPKPLCNECPLQCACLGYLHHTAEHLPTGRVKIAPRLRYFNYLHFTDGPYTYIHKREAGDIWQGLYEFPLIESDRALNQEELIDTPEFREMTGDALFVLSGTRRLKPHKLSHQTLYACVVEISLPCSGTKLAEKYLKIPIQDFPKFAVPRLIEKYQPTEY